MMGEVGRVVLLVVGGAWSRKGHGMIMGWRRRGKLNHLSRPVMRREYKLSCMLLIVRLHSTTRNGRH